MVTDSLASGDSFSSTGNDLLDMVGVIFLPDIPLKPDTVGEPGFWESMVPIWGSGRQAVHEFQSGNYLAGIGYTALAVSDVFLVKSLVTGIAKGAFKVAGSNSWRATKNWFVKTRGIASEIPLHHSFLKQRMGIGKHMPDLIKNQPWNLKPIFPRNGFSGKYIHELIHGAEKMTQQGILKYNKLQKMYYGTPLWFKQFFGSYGGRGILGILDNEE